MALVAFAACAEERTLALGDGKEIRYELVAPGSPISAAGAAQHMLALLAEGKIDDVAAMSNAPERRRQVLTEYRDRVGEMEFRRVFSQYAAPPNRFVAEAVIGERHLLVWDLAGANHALAGQYFLRAGERFVLDDVPNAERAQLGRVLQAYRSGKSKP